MEYNNDHSEVLNLQMTINETNINQNLKNIDNAFSEINYNITNHNLNEIKDNVNNYTCLTLGNLENSPGEKSEEVKERRKQSNLIIKNNKSELNRNLSRPDFICEEKEITKFLFNKRASSETNKTINGKVSFKFNDSDKYKILVKEENIVSKMKRFNSSKNMQHIVNSGHYDYRDYKNFFFLTFESIKHSTTKTHIFKEVDVEKLYKYSLIHSIPFYKVCLFYNFFSLLSCALFN